MKVLVLNCGSSSIKYKLFDMDSKEVIAQGGIEKIGLKDSFLKLTLPNGEKKILEKDIPEHTVGVEFILNTLVSPEYGAIQSLEEINAVGHRMVHGGERFSKSVLLTKEVLEAFAACNDLAPLHNPANLKGVDAITAILPNVPQIGVFDTAFHQTMPEHAYLYAIPYELYKKYGVRRYGFHGTSHRYVSQRVCEYLGIKPEGLKLITCHIGNGGSIAAIKDVILFTGGVGENQATCRAGVCEGLEFLGVKLDPEKNKVRGEEAIISTDDSRVKVVVIPTDEELLIASDTMAILDK